MVESLPFFLMSMEITINILQTTQSDNIPKRTGKLRVPDF